MYCKNCGHEIDDSSKFCGYCGAEQINEPNPFEGENIPHIDAEKVSFDKDSPEYTADNGNQYGNRDLNIGLWTILSFLEIITCCSIVPGIVGLIFSLMANSYRSSGQFSEAESYLKKAKTAVLIGIILIVIEFFLSLIGANRLTGIGPILR